MISNFPIFDYSKPDISWTIVGVKTGLENNPTEKDIITAVIVKDLPEATKGSITIPKDSSPPSLT